MRRTSSIGLLLRAFSLAVLGFVLSPGLAAAHGGSLHERIEAQVLQRADNVGTPNVETSLLPAEHQEHSSGSCAGESAGGHFADCCCNIACHAALAAPAIDDPGAHEPGGSGLAGLADMLVGLPSDGAERPPKRG